MFTALFDRPKDWLDIAAMADARAIDPDAVADVLAGLVGGDERVGHLRALAAVNPFDALLERQAR